MEKGEDSLRSWQFSEDLEHDCKNSDAIILLTEWEDYLKVNWEKISKLMRKPSWIFDTRGIINQEDLVGTDLNFNNKKIGQVLIGEPYPFALIKLFDPDFSEFKDKEISIDNVKVKLIDIS